MDLNDQLRTMEVVGRSPDGAIQATVTGDNRLRLYFQPRTYEWYDERGLSRQLSALGTTTWVAWARRREEIVRVALGRSRTEQQWIRERSGGFADGSYAARLRELDGVGRSSGGAVLLRLRGMTRWHVDIAEGTIRNWPERRFAEEAESAFGALIADRTMRLALLRAEHFEIGVPRRWRERAESAGE